METEKPEEELEASEVPELKPEKLDSRKASHKGTACPPWRQRRLLKVLPELFFTRRRCGRCRQQ